MIDDANLYDRDYFDGYYLKDDKRLKAYKDEYDRTCQAFLKTHKNIGGNVLDVGCGVGGFLHEFDDRWTKYGIEPSDFAANIAKQRGVKILSNIQTVETGSIDLVIYRGTLQHIALPMQSLCQAVRVMKPGAMLAILATPDTDSLIYKLWGNLPPLDAPRNWVLFGNKMLTNILIRHNLTCEVTHPYWNTPYASPLSDFSKFSYSLLFGWRKFAFPGNMMEVYAWK